MKAIKFEAMLSLPKKEQKKEANQQESKQSSLVWFVGLSWSPSLFKLVFWLVLKGFFYY